MVYHLVIAFSGIVGLLSLWVFTQQAAERERDREPEGPACGDRTVGCAACASSHGCGLPPSDHP